MKFSIDDLRHQVLHCANMSGPKFDTAIRLIDEAHAQDPNRVQSNGEEVPYELYYSNKMFYYLQKCDADAPETLRLAIRAQHLRRWEVPRNSYAMNKTGYHLWRTYLKKRQAEIAAQICLDSGYSSEDADRVAALVKKQNLKEDPETQTLEDVACLVFLDDQFEAFEKEHDEAKVTNILRRTWGKMSDKGHELALQIPMSDHARELVVKALADE